ncbi:MAG: efflux RND transporter periplasmic adaptor subunit [Candidatus Thiodiazotropha sp. (ex Lucinoma borealis)]|nr:efflux RND transporter periplasmic adaptor subunit [Candidatus Thiodiazotropha sp. (ex Lucinoma borealis)]MCU7862522.1 efflux RND transporter periplasmic adaptor subunit [Candidatus Thiodiazotropha sp. (ex Lucinoma borealis)]
MNLSWNRVFSRLLQGSVMVLLIVPCRLVAAEGFSLPVETAKVVRDTLVNSVQAVGTLRANESVVIRPEIEGRITKINFSEGGAIKQGELLIALDDSIYAAELRQSEARLALGRSNYKRATTLKKQGYGSEQDRDQTASELQVNQAEVVLAKARLEKTRIMAPFDGLLGLRLVSVGDYLKTGQDIVTLLDLSLLKVDFRLPETILADVKVGQEIEVVLDAFPGQGFNGEVYAIDPQIDLNGRSLLVRAKIPNRNNKLFAGQFARVMLILSRQENSLFIPEAALMPQGDQQFVYKLADGKVVWTEVWTGKRQGRRVQIVKGLSEQDEIVTAGHLKLQDGMGVAPVPVKE